MVPHRAAGRRSVNSTSFDQILRQVLIVPILAVLLGAGALAWQMNQAYRTVASIETADETITEIGTLDTYIIDQETGLRGYQTTSDPLFLEPYTQAAVKIPAQLDLIRSND